MLLARVGTVLCICIHTTSSSLVVCIQYDTSMHIIMIDLLCIRALIIHTKRSNEEEGASEI